MTSVTNRKYPNGIDNMAQQALFQSVGLNFDEILSEYRSGKRLTGKDGLLAPLIKQLTEAALEAEIESHIAQDVISGKANRRNGYNTKTMKSTSGNFELDVPRDRNSTFLLRYARSCKQKSLRL